MIAGLRSRRLGGTPKSMAARFMLWVSVGLCRPRARAARTLCPRVTWIALRTLVGQLPRLGGTRPAHRDPQVGPVRAAL